MAKNQTAESFAARVAKVPDTKQVQLLMVAEAQLSSEEYTKVLTLITGL